MEEKIKFEKVFKSDEKYKENIASIHTIWFNPWENENHQEPMIGLLQEIHSHFSMYAKTIQETKKLLSVTIQSGLDTLGSYLKSGRNQGTNIVNIGEKYEHDNFQYMDRNQRFKLIFQDAIKNLLTNIENDVEVIAKNARIVIFIDDLDRCEDETIAKLLKEIKQYLATKRCLFVFGYDRHHIEKSLSKTETKTNKETRAYLEKLFQTTFYIKEPKHENLQEFVKTKVEEYGFVESNELSFLTQFINSIIDPNPRRLKSYLTSLYFHILNTEFHVKGDDGVVNKIAFEDLKKLALIAYLKQFYESVYTALENKNDMLKSIIDVCTDKDKNKIDNAEKYFVYLEFLSHIHNAVVSEFEDDDLRKEITKNDKSLEEKFLNEIYQMQGKHKSFDVFRERFAQLFTNEENIKKYL
jgi:hypothetical protein